MDSNAPSLIRVKYIFFQDRMKNSAREARRKTGPHNVREKFREARDLSRRTRFLSKDVGFDAIHYRPKRLSLTWPIVSFKIFFVTFCILQSASR